MLLCSGEIMKKISRLALVLVLIPCMGLAATTDTDKDALMGRAVAAWDTAHITCAGISDEISKISGQTVANTVVTGVGTVAGGGALVTGIMKSQEDKKIEALGRQLCNLTAGCNPDALAKMPDSDFTKILDVLAQIADIETEIAVRTDRSVTLGNWRTGLMVGGAATGIASAILAGINTNQSDLLQHVTACNMALDNLKSVYSEMIATGINPIENHDMQRIRTATDRCTPISASDVDKIEKRMKTVMGTGISTAAIDIAGAVTSGAANSKKVRNDNSTAGVKKEKNLNTAANVMAGVGTASSLVGTGVNISLITLTKKLISQAKQCEEAL